MKEIQIKSILNKHKKRDDWFLDDYSVNPYSGCSFNCIYCYIRGSKYGENMAETLSVKINAPEILEKQLKRRAAKGEYGIILIASSTEAYLPAEEKYQITRRMLEIILKYRFPVHIVTKSPLVVRDLDILQQIDRQAVLLEDLKDKLDRGVIISFSFSSLNKKYINLFEPGAPSPAERFEALRHCSKKGFLTGANLIPLLPFLSDTEEEMEKMIAEAKNHGARFILAGALTLFGKGPADSKTLYYKILNNHFPHLVKSCKNLFRIFPYPPKEYQNKLEETAKSLCEKYHLHYRII